MNTLCYVGIPQKWESPKGVIMRTAQHNGFHTVKSMCAALEVPCHWDALDLLTEQSPLIRKLIIAAPELEKALIDNTYSISVDSTYRWIVDDIVLNRTQFAKKFTYCPECLRTETITVFQDIKGLSLCPVHHLCIVTHCPACKLCEHWTKVGLLFCKCGFDRRKTKPENGKLYEPNQLETFGHKAYLNEVSRIADIAETTEKIWASRDSSDNKTDYHLMDAIKMHAANMISTQLTKYPNFSRDLHFSPWVSTHPQLAAIASHMINEKYSSNSNCMTDQCCARVELTADQFIYSMGGKKNYGAQNKLLIAENLKLSTTYRHRRFYQSETPICKLSELKRTFTTEKVKTEFSNLNKTCKLLNCTPAKIRLLVRLRYLQTNNKNTESKTTNPNKIKVSSIKSFRHDYFLAQTIARTLNTTTAQIVHQLNLFGISPEHNFQNANIYKQHKIIGSLKKLKEALKTPLKLRPIVLPPTQEINNLLTIFSISTTPMEINYTSNHLKNESSENKKLYTTNQVVNILKVSTRLLHFQFILTGVIKPIVLRGERYYSRTDLETMAFYLENYISVKQATIILECSYNKLRSLIKSLNISPSHSLIYSNGAIKLLYDTHEIRNIGPYLT